MSTLSLILLQNMILKKADKMIKKYFILFLICVFYLIHLFLKFSQSAVPKWFSNYFADLLCLPILLSFALLVLRYLKKNQFLWLNYQQIIFAFFYTSILFEFILPKYNTSYTSDLFDVLAYGMGAVCFYFFQEKICPFIVPPN